MPLRTRRRPSGPRSGLEERDTYLVKEDTERAAKNSYTGEAERIIGAFDRLDPVTELSTKSMVIMPTPFDGALADAGLPHRQVVIQGFGGTETPRSVSARR